MIRLLILAWLAHQLMIFKLRERQIIHPNFLLLCEARFLGPRKSNRITGKSKNVKDFKTHKTYLNSCNNKNEDDRQHADLFAEGVDGGDPVQQHDKQEVQVGKP